MRVTNSIEYIKQLSYEIDTEVTKLLCDNAAVVDDLIWSKTLPLGVSKAQHYEGFSEVIEAAAQVIYDKTKRFRPNYMLVSSSVPRVLKFISGYESNNATSINGPYFAG